jgi:P-type Cu2+ transporter
MEHKNHSQHMTMPMPEMKQPPANHTKHTSDLKKRLLVCIVLTVPVLFLSQAIQTWFHYSLTLPYQPLILLALATIIYGYGGLPFLRGFIQELRQMQPGMMTLIGTAISVAFFFSVATVFIPVGTDFFWELATLIDVMLLGHLIEGRSVLGASRALEELVKILPSTAHIVKNEEIMDMPASHLRVGDVVLVRPGEKVPSDGLVIDGKSFVNETLLTGESKPILKQTNDKVIGGSVNGDGALQVRIEKTGKETYLSQVIVLVKQARQSRSRTQDLANRAAAFLFYVALGVGIVTFAVWATLGNVQFAITRSVTVLVIACPHALGLAIPLVVALSTSITAKNGILIRDRKAFEQMKDINVVVFDKTGTLTLGQLRVSDVVSYIEEEKLLKLTTAVEQNSEHTIANSIVQYAKTKNTIIPQSNGFMAFPGKGAKAMIGGKQVYVGSSNLLRELNIETNDNRALSLEGEGKTVVFTVVDGKLAGVFALADKVREESREAVRILKEQGVGVYMLTGDSDAVAKNVSAELGIKAYFAGVLPGQKAEKIKALQAEGFKVAMVGDGVNDAPALATANVGIAIGAGTDVALESADIILVKNDPRDVPRIAEFSKKTCGKMIQNLWWATGYNIFAIPLAAGVFSGLGIIIDPAVGAILMSLSTVLVAINSRTLRE